MSANPSVRQKECIFARLGGGSEEPRRRPRKTRLNRGFFQYFAEKAQKRPLEQPKWAYLSSKMQNQGGKTGEDYTLER
jgi:hypothetical protein